MNISSRAAALAAALLLPALAVSAQPNAATPDTPPAGQSAVDSDNSTTANLAFVGGTPFLRIHTSWGGLSPEERMTQVQERINAAFALGPLYPGDITSGKLDGDWVVMLRGKRFFTADPGSAAYHHSTPQKLAEEWAARMRQILPDLTRQTEVAPKPDTTAPTPTP